MYSIYSDKINLKIEASCDSDFLRGPSKSISKENFIYNYLVETVCYPDVQQKSFFKRMLIATYMCRCPFIKQRLRELIEIELKKSKMVLISLLYDKHFLIHLNCSCTEEEGDLPYRDEFIKDLMAYKKVITEDNELRK